jgi:hypothetical protein
MKSLPLVGMLCLALATLSGCSTGRSGEQVIGRPGSPLWFSSASMATKTHYYKQSCFAYGFKDGTPEMAQCLQTEMQSGKSSARDRVNSMNRSVTCTTYGNRTTCR